MNLTLVEIQDYFVKLQTCLGAVITNHMASAQAVIDTLFNLPASYLEAVGTPLFPQILLPPTPSVRHVTNLVNNFTSFLSYSLIASCIQEVGKGREQLLHQLREYTRLVDHFISTTSLASFLFQQLDKSVALMEPLPGTQPVQIVLGEEWKEQTIKHFMEMIESLVCEVFPCQGLVFQSLFMGRMSLIETTWLTTANVVSALITMFDKKKSILKSKRIVRIRIGEISILDLVPTPRPRTQRTQSCAITHHIDITKSSDEVITNSTESVDSVFSDETDARTMQEQATRPVPKPRKHSPKAPLQSRPFSDLFANPSYMISQDFPLSEEDQHYSPRQFYCQTCSKYLSTSCIASGQHHGHTLFPVEENAPFILQQLKQSLEQNNRTERMAMTKGRDIVQMLNDIDQSYTAASQSIGFFFEHMRHKAECRKKELMMAAMTLKSEIIQTTSGTRNKLLSITESCKTLKEHQDAIMESLQARSSPGVTWATDSRKKVCEMQQDFHTCSARMKEGNHTIESIHFEGNVENLERALEAVGCYSEACRKGSHSHSAIMGGVLQRGSNNKMKPLQSSGDSNGDNTTVKGRPLPPTPLETHISQNHQRLQPVGYEIPLSQSFPPIQHPKQKEQQIFSFSGTPDKPNANSSHNKMVLYSRLNFSCPSGPIGKSCHPLPAVLECRTSSAQYHEYCRIDSLEEQSTDDDSQTQNIRDSDVHYYSVIRSVEEECRVPHENQEPMGHSSEGEVYYSRVPVTNDGLYVCPGEEEPVLNRQRSESQGSSCGYISMKASVHPHLIIDKDHFTQNSSSTVTPTAVCSAGDGLIGFATPEDSLIRFITQSGSCTDQVISCPSLLPHTLAVLSLAGEPGIGIIQKGKGEKCQFHVFYMNGLNLQAFALPDIDTPGGVAVDRANNVYVSEEKGSIYTFSLSGEFLQRIDIHGAGKLGGLLVMDDGSIMVTDTTKNCLWMVEKSGTNIRMLCDQFLAGPCSISLSTDKKHLFITEKIDHMIAIIDRQTETIHSSFGGRGSSPGEFKFPQGVCQMPDGSLVIADSGNQRLQLFSAPDIAKYILSSPL